MICMQTTLVSQQVTNDFLLLFNDWNHCCHSGFECFLSIAPFHSAFQNAWPVFRQRIMKGFTSIDQVPSTGTMRRGIWNVFEWFTFLLGKHVIKNFPISFLERQRVLHFHHQMTHWIQTFKSLTNQTSNILEDWTVHGLCRGGAQSGFAGCGSRWPKLWYPLPEYQWNRIPGDLNTRLKMANS